MTIAQAHYFTHSKGEWIVFRVELDLPEKAPEGTDFFCRVCVGEESKEVWGIDSVQALLLAVLYVQTRLRDLVERGVALYLSKDLDQRVDVASSFLGDFSQYLSAKNPSEVTS